MRRLHELVRDSDLALRSWESSPARAARCLAIGSQEGISVAGDPDTFAPPAGANQYAAGDWSDYDGDVAYGDFSLTIESDDPVVSEAMRYLPGVGRQSAVGQSPTVWHHLGDLVGSTVAVTSDQGASETVRYTAFGEPAAGATDFSGGAEQPWQTAETRYAYAGANGYESGLLTLAGAPGTSPLTFQHLGWRWYQPDIGRFIQRDPIGLSGGVNTYVYSDNAPIGRIDPAGLFFKWYSGAPWWANLVLFSTPEFLDDPVTTKKVQKSLNVVAIVCAGAVSPLPMLIRVPLLIGAGTLNVWY